MKVTTILFILWFIVFAGWVVKQFAAANRRAERKEE